MPKPWLRGHLWRAHDLIGRALEETVDALEHAPDAFTVTAVRRLKEDLSRHQADLKDIIARNE